ncbi:DUF6286 domain-containing protein [Arthrobacter agilis]|uniref:DUF6286 domain-containing protein n=1 Tax=Arthrobacter agilis TaxID=37921 RepID=UPI0027872004|nr:DUF6286 domain-containing protein [Arthrobacter agilis]MDQ0734855.1 hypothetical protein [Arthrobacter agilis]
MSSTTIRRRPTRSMPAIICAAVLLAAATAAVWAGSTALSGDTRAVDAALAATGAPWSAQATLVAAILTAVTGLFLILIALTPGRYDAHVLEHGGTARAALRNRALEVLLADTATSIDGVDAARATVTDRRADTRVATYVSEHRDLRTTVTRTLQRRIDALELAHPPRASVSVTAHKD